MEQRTCAYCGREIEESRRRDAKFCSDACRAEAFRANPCTYCGMPATERDHVTARRQRETIRLRYGEMKAAELAKHIVPSCGECNRIAGAKLFYTVVAKRRYIQSVLRKKYAKVLEYYDFSPEEINEFEGFLKQAIIAGLEAKRLTRARLAWTGSGGNKRRIPASTKKQDRELEILRNLGLIDKTPTGE